MGMEKKDNMAENTAAQDIEENIESVKSEKKRKREKKPRKGNYAMQKVLCFLQHTALAVMVAALLLVIGSSMVRVSNRYSGISTFYLFGESRYNTYEDSDMFNTLFGYAFSDLVRHGVVSSQLETDGSFDSSKVIDVTAYNYRSDGLPEQYVTAEYYLGDLLKWYNYGFEWSSVQMTGSQARAFLADKTRVTVIDTDSQYYNTSDAGYLRSDLGNYTFVRDVSANQLWVDTDDYDGYVEGYPNTYTEDVAESPVGVQESASNEVIITYNDDETISSYNVLVNRYKTVEKKNIEEYVSDWDLYHDLCLNVQSAANGLSYNYEEYQECSEYYDIRNSNVRYIIMKTVGDDTQIYTNLTDGQELEDITANMISGNISEEMLQNVGDKYLYYSPADMVYQTNTSIAEHTVRGIFQTYDYAYPEAVKMWMSVDGAYTADDAFRQGMLGYRNHRPYLWQGLAVAAAAGILYLIILIYLTCVTGKDVDEEGRACIRLHPFDKVPTEVAILLACCVIVMAVFVLIAVTSITRIDISDIFSIAQGVVNGESYGILLIVIAVCVFAANFFAMLFFYSLVRRIRAKTLWKNSYLRRMIKCIIEFAWKAYDNGDIILRTWVPYVAFLLFHFLMLLFLLMFDDGFGVVITLTLMVAVDILVGNLIFRNAREKQNIVKGIETIAGGQLDHQVETENLHGDNLTLAHSVNSIGKGIKEAVEISMKDERMKADLITNVSHDIKTPLTSIINYVDLIKREQVENEKIKGYINVLDEKSQRLKQLTDDLVEASKISSGNISLHFEKINLTELMNQTIGEFSEKFEQKKLTTVMNINVQNAVIEADSRRIWRVIENLFNNIYKYAMEGTRVYLSIDSLPDKAGYITLSVKNISASPLNCDPAELTERFIRGDESRTTEGSGLGLSIAKNLTEAQEGTFEIQLDGDLFKVILTFPLAEV